MAALRALILVRLSRVTDATTSPERQRAECERVCAERGWTVVGAAEDLDVSGAVDPLGRDGIGPWLRDRLGEFDVIVAWKLDRVGRSARHISDLMNYLVDHGKSLVCAQDQIDISSPMGRMIVYILGTLAEMELAAMSDRNTGAAQHNIRAGKYRGGPAPAGYRAERDDAGDWRLVPDEAGTAPIVREIVERVLSGQRVTKIVADLNRRGVPTAKDRQAVLNGRESSGRAWSVSNLRRMIASPTIIGQVVHRESERLPDGTKVYGSPEVLRVDGAPVVRADPLVSPVDFYEVRDMMDERRRERPGQKHPANPGMLTRVLFCGVCGSPMWRLKGGPGRQDRYRCGSTQSGVSCGSGSVTIAEADDVVSRTIAGVLQSVPHVERQHRAGSDPAGELVRVNAELDSLSQSVTRFPAGSPALERLLGQVDALSARRAELAAQPVSESGWTYVPTDETAAEHFLSLDTVGRNDYLRDREVRVDYACRPGGGSPSWHFDVPELAAMVTAAAPGLLEDAWWIPEDGVDALAEVMRNSGRWYGRSLDDVDPADLPD